MTRRRRALVIGGLAIVLVGLGLLTVPTVRRQFHPLIVKVRGAYTVEERVATLGEAEQRLRGRFERAGVAYPPSEVVLLGLKDEERVEVYARPMVSERVDDASERRGVVFVDSFGIRRASGGPGPKLREGDRQVPEGVYAVKSLNPNSRYHVAIRVGYPSEFDKANAEADGRTKLGGDIMIHGGAASVGCLAMGDEAAEELFVLVARTGIERCTIVLSPVDLRERELPAGLDGGWRNALYGRIRQTMAELPRRPH